MAVDPAHNTEGPLTDAGCEKTVMVLVTEQAPPNKQVIVAVPAATPVTIPDEVPTVAIDVLLLVHIPPAVASLNVVVEPTQTLPLPPMVESPTVTFAVQMQ